MSSDSTTASGQEPPSLGVDEITFVKGTTSRLWHIILIAFIAIAFTAVFISVYEWLNEIIWFSNDYATTNRWVIPVGVLGFSLLVGLCQKYLHAPTVINGGFAESLRGSGEKANYRTFPGALLSSLFSLLSGASIGPEGTIALLVGDIAVFVREKLKIAVDSANEALGFDVAALASGFNGIVGNVLFTGILATEFQVGGKKDAFRFITWNLLAGAIGFFFYMALGLSSFAKSIPFTPITDMKHAYIVYAILLGLVGALLAIFCGISMQAAGRIMARFEHMVVLRILIAGAVIAVVGYFLPLLLFSGEVQIHTVIDNPAQLGIAMLLLLAILKILLLGLSFKSGYIGGPIFPILFASTMVGLALSLAFPDVPVGIFVLCIEAAAVTLALGAPLTAIVLVAVVGTADAYMIGLFTLSAVVAMLVSLSFRQWRETKDGEKNLETN